MLQRLAFLGGIRTPGEGVRTMRPGVKCVWNEDRSGSIVICTHPGCDEPRREYTGPKAAGDEQARWHRQRHNKGR